MKKCLLLIPFFVSSLGWATLPALANPNRSDSEGALWLMSLGGIFATFLTPPLVVVVLSSLGYLEHMSRPRYLAALLLFGLPALSFEAIAVSASVMPGFLGNWSLSLPSPQTEIIFGAAFAVLYAALGLASYPFVRRGQWAARVTAFLMPFAMLLLIFVGTRF